MYVFMHNHYAQNIPHIFCKQTFLIHAIDKLQLIVVYKKMDMHIRRVGSSTNGIPWPCVGVKCKYTCMLPL